LRREIRKTRELTDKPFAVDLLAPIPYMIGRTCRFIKSPAPRSKV
jgi:hypothetical protein